MARYFAGRDSYVGGGTRTIFTSRGKLLALLASHDKEGIQAVTVYDGAAPGGHVMLKLLLGPGQVVYLPFPPDFPLLFENGLSVEAGECHVSLIAAGG